MGRSTGQLAGKITAITGAARGIGKATAEHFAQEEAVVIALDIAEEEGARLATHENVFFRRHDVGSESDWQRTVDWIIEQFGRIDVLVNNAAVQYEMPIEDTPCEAFEHVIRINQIGPFLGMRSVIPPMKQTGRGAIVNVSSSAGLGGRLNMCAYVSSKYAVRGMTKVAALELAKSGIRVNSVHPGLTDTPMTQRHAPDVRDARARATPFGRAGEPAEIARLILFLSSDAASFCSGGEYTCDGALTASPRF
ncbi:short-chain dehydrogenase/reductase SDR [Burkholderia multivorans]|uniref:SDR family NAD(P)-dependent oxidoreductase n=1 Tax=Burkholderia multivorans TaxID=87883 RepID=UPI0019C5CEBA|nr:SDR family oxidoreductase [Burkholderia multivorans]MBU9669189.1 SDR family oxidoreductase [Burkholderia multivorans]CAB5300962.1 short-chain dehydrogenase/reductase SDR [Burkholderia multivorans]CAB5305568.1 short-chain dehydrogenase/reductase SDR [Burkholderia multivorans]CAB5310467.1 short-chain dehydrogenase/reductase SDR [Burkholderia multivorans]CAB5312492.1 short-chain dehydrogenase/reductase SDR [Burkholderia multivorans]